MKTLKTTSPLSITALVTGAMISAVGSANASDLFTVNDLGSGAELRSNLIAKNSAIPTHQFLQNADLELKCGEGKCGEAKCGEKTEKEEKASKSSEQKCGEAKCGEKSKEKKVEKETETKASEAKCGEGKCGEGSCGSK